MPKASHRLQPVVLDFPTLIRERLEREKQLSTASKAQILEELRTDGDNWGAYLDTVSEEALAQIVQFPEPAVPPVKSRFEMLLSVKEHEMHHRAQLMVFQRLLGLVPHLTRDRQARMGAHRPPARANAAPQSQSRPSARPPAAERSSRKHQSYARIFREY